MSSPLLVFHNVRIVTCAPSLRSDHNVRIAPFGSSDDEPDGADRATLHHYDWMSVSKPTGRILAVGRGEPPPSALLGTTDHYQFIDGKSRICCNKVKPSPWKDSMIHANPPPPLHDSCMIHGPTILTNISLCYMPIADHHPRPVGLALPHLRVVAFAGEGRRFVVGDFDSGVGGDISGKIQRATRQKQIGALFGGGHVGSGRGGEPHVEGAMWDQVGSYLEGGMWDQVGAYLEGTMWDSPRRAIGGAACCNGSSWRIPLGHPDLR